jgi:hypothetical protein
MLFNKPLAEIKESDLQTLIDNKVSERKIIEYKRDLPGEKYKDRKEFLADVSSFANTAGGYLIYGIATKQGVPIELYGVEIANIDDFKLVCENRLRDGLSPQIPPVDFQFIELKPNTYVIILHIPRSWLAPHRVTLEHHGHFYGRNSAGHFQMDVPQLRAAFELLGVIAERIRAFRAERLNRIESGEEIPALLDEEAAKLVLHLIPASAFNPLVPVDIKILNDSSKWDLLRPLVVWDQRPDIFPRFNLDGIAISAQWIKDAAAPVPIPAGYVQVFRNGIVEVVDVTLLGINGEKKQFHGETFEKRLLQAVKQHIGLQQFLGCAPPVFIMVSLLGVRGYKISHGSYPPSLTEEIDRTNLIISDTVIDTFEGGSDYIAEVMRPVFDTIWNAANYAASPNYDKDGKYRRWWG